MENIHTAAELRKAILVLEDERLIRERNLKLQWDEVAESLRPVNILKRSLQDLFQRGGTKPNLLGSVLALGTGFMSKKLFEGKSPGPIRKTAGSALQLGVTTLVAKNGKAIKSKGISLIKKIFKSKK